MKARFSILLSLVLSATAFAAPIPPGTPCTLHEIRGHAALERAAARIGILQFQFQFPDEEATVLDFLRNHDVVDTTVNFHLTGSQPKAHFLALSPADRQAFLDLLSAESRTREPDTPEGFQVFVPPSTAFRYHIAAVDGKTAFAKDPDALRAALDLYPSLPDRLPADGDIAFQFGGEEVMRTSFLSPSLTAEIQGNVDTLAVGFGTDADSLALHAILAPRTTSQLAAHLRSCGPIPPSTACVNLPGAIAFFAEGPAPTPFSSSFGTQESAFLSALARRTGNQPFSAAFHPPATPGAFPRILGFQGLNDLHTARSALHSLFARHSDAFALVSSPSHRGIPVDTLYASDPDAIADFLETHLGHNRHNPEARALILRSFATGRRGLSFAWLPEGLLFSLNDAGDTLLHSAIDAALDGTATPFEQTPAFPEPDGPAHVLARLDLPTIAPFLPSPFDSLCRQVPASCPVDLFACVAPDGSLVIRLRAPLSLPQAFAHSKNQGTRKYGPVK
ncbi:MAG: hypothetical protein IJS32_08175 [Kiritimatiellae bacterium]|nr:hypothetical protein [Kiritimatiellia bacterium]